MTPRRRWSVVALVVAAVVGLPLLPRLLPAAEADVSTATLLQRVQASGDRSYQGYVETRGTLPVAVGGQFSVIGDLVGGSTRLRVWWRDEASWRVDRLETAGEVDLVRQDESTTEFDYERLAATSSVDPPVRLPRTADLVPPSLARITFEGATTDEVTRLPARRVAGVDAAGLRLTPDDGVSAVDHVDAWVDPTTGLALRVEVWSGGDRPDVETAFADFSTEEPDTSEVTFRPPADVEWGFEDTFDVVDAANQYAPLVVPGRVAGLRLDREQLGRPGAVGVYGEGVSRVLVVPLRDKDADSLRDSLLSTPGATRTRRGTGARVGPLGVMVTGDEGDFGWLVAGSVTPATLDEAADDVVARARFTEDRR